MTTYNSEYYWRPARRKKQRYALIQRVIDFSQAPVTDKNGSTTAWASGDVLEAIGIKAGQTVLGVQFEIIERTSTANAVIKVGYGSGTAFWGQYKISKPANSDFGFANNDFDGSSHEALMLNFGNPIYFAAKDTIDVKINQALTNGRFRLVAHILEDDR